MSASFTFHLLCLGIINVFSHLGWQQDPAFVGVMVHGKKFILILKLKCTFEESDKAWRGTTPILRRGMHISFLVAALSEDKINSFIGVSVYL